MTERPEHECAEHLHFTLGIKAFGDTNLKYLEARAHCRLCGRRAQFRGALGVNPSGGTVSLDGLEATTPFVFEGEIYDKRGKGFGITSPQANEKPSDEGLN